MQTAIEKSPIGIAASQQGGACANDSIDAGRFVDLQAVDRFLPNCDWFERDEDRDDATRAARELRAGRCLELKF